MKIRVFQPFDHTAIAAAIGQFPQARSVLSDDVRMAVVVLAGDEHQPFAIGRPLWDEVEGFPSFDLPLLATIGVGDIDLIVLVIADPRPVGRGGITVGKPTSGTRNVAFVATIAVHDEWLGYTINQWSESVTGAIGTKEQTGVVAADTINRRQVVDRACCHIEQAGIHQPAFGHAEGLVLPLPLGVLGAFP